MFQSIDEVAADLRMYSASDWQPTFGPQSLKTEVGRAILQIASGKSATNAAPIDGDSESLTAAARRVVSEVMLAPAANHFTVLGLDPDATPSDVRDHFRRLMALVHPDANPVGFPADAAARVNLAYAVLSGETERTEYRARLLASTGIVGAGRDAAAYADLSDAHVSSHSAPRAGLFGALVGALRSRHALPWLAAVLALPAVFVVWSMLGQSEPVRLVDASERAATGRTGLPPAPSSAASSSTVAAIPNGTSDAAVATGAPAVTPIAPGTPTGPAASFHLNLVDTLSDRSMELAAARRPAKTRSAGSVVTSPATSNVADPTPVSLAPAGPASPVPAPVTAEPAMPAPPVAARPSPEPPAVSTAAASGVAPAAATNLPSNAVPPTAKASPAPAPASAEPLRPRDVEDVLLRFVNAYEAGSVNSVSQLLSPRMVGRRQMLSDYERVFASTRTRSIKLYQMKHSVQGDRISTAGYATVSTTDHDNRTAVQRVFLDIEIARDGGQARIERLANYSVN